MITGHITINTADDAAMIAIFEACQQSKGLSFQNQTQFSTQSQGNPPKQVFNNVLLLWQGAEGLNSLAVLLQKLAGIA